MRSLICLLVILLSSCGSETRSEVVLKKRIVTISRTIQQVIAPDGVSIVKLESVTKTVTDEDGQQIGNEEVTVKQPEVIGTLAGLVKPVVQGLATATAGPAAGQAAGMAIDWVSTLIGGGSAATLAAGTGYAAIRRKHSEVEEMKEQTRRVARQRDELIDGAERSKSKLDAIVLGKDHEGEDITAWDHLTTALEAEQSKDTKDAVKARVG